MSNFTSEVYITKNIYKPLEGKKNYNETYLSVDRISHPIVLCHFEDEEQIRDKFYRLAKQWEKETKFLSAIDKICLNSNYQNIIGMGREVIPILLIDLKETNRYWFWALKAISEQDPVEEKYRGDIKEMVKIWLEWGKEKEYVD